MKRLLLLSALCTSMFANKTADFPIAVSPHKDTGQVKAGFVRIIITGCQRPENSAGIYTLKVFQR
jgi:hypothetical protein